MSAPPPSYDDVVQGNRRPQTLTARISQLIPAPPSYASLFGRNATAPSAPPEEPQPPLPYPQPNTIPAPLPNTRPDTTPTPVSLEEGTPSTSEPEQRQGIPDDTTATVSCSSCKKYTAEDICKKFYTFFFGAAVFLSIPTGISLIIIAQTDEPYDEDTFTTTALSVPTTPYPDYDLSTIEYGADPRCPASRNLPVYMTVSGALALIVCVLFIASACSKEQKEKKGQGLIFVPILAMVGIYFAGCVTIFQLWINRPNGCSPWDEFGCPRWYCGNRLMSYALIFYSGSLVLLSPLWLLIVGGILYFIFKALCQKNCPSS